MGRYGGAPTAAGWGEDCRTGPGSRSERSGEAALSVKGLQAVGTRPAPGGSVASRPEPAQNPGRPVRAGRIASPRREDPAAPAPRRWATLRGVVKAGSESRPSESDFGSGRPASRCGAESREQALDGDRHRLVYGAEPRSRGELSESVRVRGGRAAEGDAQRQPPRRPKRRRRLGGPATGPEAARGS